MWNSSLSRKWGNSREDRHQSLVAFKTSGPKISRDHPGKIRGTRLAMKRMMVPRHRESTLAVCLRLDYISQT